VNGFGVGANVEYLSSEEVVINQHLEVCFLTKTSPYDAPSNLKFKNDKIVKPATKPVEFIKTFIVTLFFINKTTHLNNLSKI